MNLFVKRCFTVFLIACTLLGLIISVKAHSGKTDGAGGHYNHSTGEYHYHHGYSAHQHYDMDGDGKADCPYTFKDKTNHITNNSNNSSESTTDNIKNNKKGISFFDVLKAMLTELVPAIGFGLVISHAVWLFISLVFSLIFGKDIGCLMFFICWVVVFIGLYTWLIYIKVT